MSRREKPAVRDQAEEVVAEAEAILHGRGMQRPPGGYTVGWASVNTLAHAGWASLSDLADGTVRTRTRQWDAALRFLASELLAATRSPANLLAAQRARVIPIELDVLAGVAPAPSTPVELLNLVLPRIDRPDGRRHHPTGGYHWPGPAR